MLYMYLRFAECKKHWFTSFFQLLGHFVEGMWQGGLFPKILRDSSYLADAVKTYLGNYNKEKLKGKQELPSILLRWIVMDGVLHPSWTEGLNTVVDCEKKLSMANCGQVPLSSMCTCI